MTNFDWQGLVSIRPFEWPAVLAALFCGGIIGAERQLRGKPVGIRTATLITLGTYTFVEISDTQVLGGGDPTRVIGQVVTGIGFLGAGVMLARDGIVSGVTSAATIWILAALGVTIGVGELAPACKLAVLTVVILAGVELVEKRTVALTSGAHGRLTLGRRKDRDDSTE